MPPANYEDSDGEDIDGIVITHDDISDYNPSQVLPLTGDKLSLVREWLQATSYELPGGEYRKHHSTYMEGTGRWLTSTSTYQEWLEDQEHGLLWIKGIPGSGKSVMAAKLIDELAKSNPTSPVLFFFFRQIIDANHEPLALLRDWMDQVLLYSPPLQQQLLSYVTKGLSLDSMSPDDLWRDLKMALENLPGKSFCIADALDEMDKGNESFLKALGSFGRWRPDKVKVLITSRPVSSVEEPLRLIPYLGIRLHETLVDGDISMFVRHSLAQSNIGKNDWKTIADAVPGRAKGLFLYARLAMDAFLEPGANIGEVLSRLPTDLNMLYTDLLEEHARRAGVDGRVQHLILQAVTHANRPLRLLELAEMTRVTDRSNTARDLKAAKDLVKAACGPLLEILADETVSVIHHSFTEYLKGTTRVNNGSGYPILRMAPTHAQLAIACLRYLQAGALDSLPARTFDYQEEEPSFWIFGIIHRQWDLENTSPSTEEISLRLQYPFLGYALANWAQHVNKSESAEGYSAEVATVLSQLLENSHRLKAWVHLRWPTIPQGRSLVTEVHVAAKMGLLAYIRTLKPAQKANINGVDGCGRSAIWWAATEGHASVIRELVAAGADPDRDDSVEGLKPLHEAAKKNHYEAVAALLEAGVDALTVKTLEHPGRQCGNAPTSIGHTPLMYACENGHLEAVDAFLKHINDINTVHRALAWAASGGRAKVIERVLQHPGVDVNCKIRGDTPLFLACGQSDVDSIRILLQNGADPSIKCEGSGGEFERNASVTSMDGPQLNCLHQLCKSWHRSVDVPSGFTDILSLLVESGADINQRCPRGRTPLHGAIRSPGLTRMLISAGADVKAADKLGMTPLHLATSEDVVAALVEEGNADMTAKNAKGQTPLHTLVSFCRDEALLRLLEYRSDCNLMDEKGNTALHTALTTYPMKPPGVLRAMITNGADPKIRNHDGESPHFCIRDISSVQARESMDVLLSGGADIDARDKDGRTLLFRHIRLISSGEDRKMESIQYLVKCGASTSARDFKGRTILHEALRNPHMFDLLRQWRRDLDLNAVDYVGNGLLHELALSVSNHDYSAPKTLEFWKKLVGLGLDTGQKNNKGWTPLHILCTTRMQTTNLSIKHRTPVDFLISLAKDLDEADVDGNRPLHLAVGHCEAYAKKLLDAGADPTVRNYEGLTPLHVAARCKQSNIVGLLLEVMSRSHSPSRNSPHPGVNAEASYEIPRTRSFASISPLYYACQSGRPETVSLLLEAGANPNIGNLFNACASFENEDRLWKREYQPPAGEKSASFAVPLKIKDTCRPVIASSHYEIRPSEENETTRLEEVLGMIVKHGIDASQLRPVSLHYYHGPIAMAAELDSPYAQDCLTTLWRAQPDEAENQHGESIDVYFAKHMSDALKDTAVGVAREHFWKPSQPIDLGMFKNIIRRRQYYLVDVMLRDGVVFLGRGAVCLDYLIRHGFAGLFDKIADVETKRRLKNGEWHAFGDNTEPGLHYSPRNQVSSTDHWSRDRQSDPLLYTAVDRTLPNMEIVRLLVDKYKVDVNGTSKNVFKGSTALHCAARGRHWWHVAQALPYLIKSGANVNARNACGETPLQVALKCDGPYFKEAARALIEVGADLSVTDKDGRTSLSMATHSEDLVRLLIKHGAVVTLDAVFTAIEYRNAASIQAVLDNAKLDLNSGIPWPPGGAENGHGNNVNIIPGNIGMGRFRRDTTVPHEVLPLYFAALNEQFPSNPEQVKMVQMLLDYGADPFGTFLAKPVGQLNGQIDTSTVPMDGVPTGYEKRVVLHELFRLGKVSDVFLKIPNLDVNFEDCDGCTLLHASCQGDCDPDQVIDIEQLDRDKTDGQESRTTVFQQLLSLGANIRARSSRHGSTILHDMIGMWEGNNLAKFEKSFTEAVSTAPDLLTVADIDGNTPFHYGILQTIRLERSDAAELLLSSGADPLAVNNAGDSALHILASKLAVECVRSLFESLVSRGLDANARNKAGRSPLLEFGNPTEIVESAPGYWSSGDGIWAKQAVATLAKVGADFSARDAQGRSVLHFAATGDADVFKALVAIGVDVMLEDDEHQTAIDVAAACGNNAVLELFDKEKSPETADKMLG